MNLAAPRKEVQRWRIFVCDDFSDPRPGSFSRCPIQVSLHVSFTFWC
jgi:hypothetical protein